MNKYYNPPKSIWKELIKRPAIKISFINKTIDYIFNLVQKKGDDAIRLLTKEFDKIDFVEIFPEKVKKLHIHDENSIIGLGWSHNLGSSGVWTEGNEANIIFKFKNYEPRDYTLRFKIKSVITNNTDKLNMRIMIMGDNNKFLYLVKYLGLYL